ncbi:MAG: acetylxylan esterase [Tepidisphaeraceae bacterium]|jgi:cephalosporin-C deacetylase
MPSIDMPLEQLRQYKPSLYREENFQSFWDQTVAGAIMQPLNAELIPYPFPAKGIECFAVRFDGYKGGRLAGWFVRPDAPGHFPAVCLYHGYSRRGPRPLELIPYATLGMCALSLDCRGQNGQSQDAAIYPEGHSTGWMTAGIRDPWTYYYRYVYADAIRALELLAARDEVDAKRLAVAGASQGGGLALAAAALSRRPILALPDIPFLCDYRRAIQLAPSGPYAEIANFLRAFPNLYDQAIRTLGYFDCLNLAPWIACRTAISSGLWDDTCPPSTIYAVYNHITAEKQMEIYPFERHEVAYDHQELKMRLLAEVLRP